ncbi:hypothetical protein P9112_003076 [Eukaryota sp. TZLM1-RC]
MNCFTLVALLALLLTLVYGDPMYTLIVRNPNSWYTFHHQKSKLHYGTIQWIGGAPGNIGAGKTESYRFSSMNEFITPKQRTFVTVTWVTHTMFGNPKETIVMGIRMDERGWLTAFDCTIEDNRGRTHLCRVHRDDYEITVLVDTSQR